MDANVFITTRKEMAYIASKIFPLGQFVGIEGLDGYKAGELANHVQIKVKIGYNVTEIASQIRSALSTMPGANFSVFEYKRVFIDKLASTGALAITVDPSVDVDTVLESIKEWYVDNGLDWRLSSVGTVERLIANGDSVIIAPVFSMFFVVAVFSLLVNAVGLCTILYANARKRHREFGILKALGYSSKTVRDIIFLESFLVTVIGLVAGIFAGILVMWTVYQSISSSVLIPMLFSIPILTMIFISGLLIGVSLVSSYLIARHVTKLSIADNIRYRE
jgi:ABC-type antimicrobial peptide transport system permease subunit